MAFESGSILMPGKQSLEKVTVHEVLCVWVQVASLHSLISSLVRLWGSVITTKYELPVQHWEMSVPDTRSWLGPDSKVRNYLPHWDLDFCLHPHQDSGAAQSLWSSSEPQKSHHHHHPLVLNLHHYHSRTNSQILWIQHLTLRNCTCKYCTEGKCFMHKDAHCPIYTGTWGQPIRTSVNPHFQISQERCLERVKSYGKTYMLNWGDKGSVKTIQKKVNQDKCTRYMHKITKATTPQGIKWNDLSPPPCLAPLLPLMKKTSQHSINK